MKDVNGTLGKKKGVLAGNCLSTVRKIAKQNDVREINEGEKSKTEGGGVSNVKEHRPSK